MYLRQNFENAWKQKTVFVMPVKKEFKMLKIVENTKDYSDCTEMERAYKQKNCFCTPVV